MNKKQLISLWIGIIAIVLMGLYPPWMMTGGGSILGFGKWGYSFIMNPPHEACRIDTSRLGVQWAMVAAVTGGLVVAFTDKKDKKPKDERNRAHQQNEG